MIARCMSSAPTFLICPPRPALAPTCLHPALVLDARRPPLRAADRAQQRRLEPPRRRRHNRRRGGLRRALSSLAKARGADVAVRVTGAAAPQLRPRLVWPAQRYAPGVDAYLAAASKRDQREYAEKPARPREAGGVRPVTPARLTPRPARGRDVPAGARAGPAVDAPPRRARRGLRPRQPGRPHR